MQQREEQGAEERMPTPSESEEARGRRDAHPEHAEPKPAHASAKSEDTGSSADRPAAGAGAKRPVLLAAGAVVAVLAIVILVWLFACSPSGYDADAQSGQAPYKTEEEMQAERERTVEEGMFSISIASVIQFDNAESIGTAYIENVPGNRFDMKVTITEDDTGDVLYQSGLLAPDQYIEFIKLDKQLDAGTYNATATFKAFDMETGEEAGQAAAKVTLNILH